MLASQTTGVQQSLHQPSVVNTRMCWDRMEISSKFLTTQRPSTPRTHRFQNLTSVLVTLEFPSLNPLLMVRKDGFKWWTIEHFIHFIAAQAYHAPAQAYHAPAQDYHQPAAQVYHQPAAQVYHQPAQAYHQPAAKVYSSYSAPAAYHSGSSYQAAPAYHGKLFTSPLWTLNYSLNFPTHNSPTRRLRSTAWLVPKPNANSSIATCSSFLLIKTYFSVAAPATKLLGVAYSPATAVSHMSYSAPLISYGKVYSEINFPTLFSTFFTFTLAAW